MSAYSANTRTETLTLFIGNGMMVSIMFCFKLIQTSQLLFEFIIIFERHLVDTLLYDSQTL